MREIGLGPLAQGAILSRADWEGGVFSLMQRAARDWSWGRPTANEDGTGVAAFIIPSPVQNEGIVMRMCVSRMQGVGLALAAFVLLAAGATAHGDSVTDKLRNLVRPAAENVIAIVKQENQTTIAVGAFNGPAQFTTNYGVGIEQVLGDALESLQPKISTATATCRSWGITSIKSRQRRFRSS